MLETTLMKTVCIVDSMIQHSGMVWDYRKATNFTKNNLYILQDQLMAIFAMDKEQSTAIAVVSDTVSLSIAKGTILTIFKYVTCHEAHDELHNQ